MDNAKQKDKKEETNRSRKNFKKATFSGRRRKMQKIVQKSKSAPLSSSDLLHLVRGQQNFLGIFASDELSNLRIVKDTVFFIANLDTAYQAGSHWLAIRIGRRNVEIFDSLGFDFQLWQTYPKHLLDFLSRYSKSHNFLISPALQPPNTFTCGLYCVYFIYFRQRTTFSNCVRTFSRNFELNNEKLFHYLDKLF